MQYLRITNDAGTQRWANTFEHKYSRHFDAPPEGHVYAADLLDGKIDVVAEAQVEIVDAPWRSDVHREVQAVVDADYEAALKRSRAMGGKFGKGRIFHLGVGDGRAFYIVTKVTPRYCWVEWRSWGGEDHYTDQVLGFGGRFDRNIIEPLVGRQGALDSIFGAPIEGLAD